MFNIKNYFLILFLNIILTFGVYAEDKIFYLDLDLLVSNTNAGKSLLLKLNNNEKEIFDKFKIEEKKFKDEEIKILGSKNIISEDELKKNITQFQKKLKNFKKLKSEEIQNLKKTRNEQIINLLNLINPIIQEYMNKNSISMVIDKKNVYIANTKLDITNNIIELINKNIK